MWDVFFPLGTFKRRKEKAYAHGGTRFASIVRKAKPQNEVAEDASEQMLREQTCVSEAEVSRGWAGCREPALVGSLTLAILFHPERVQRSCCISEIL